MRIGNFAKLCKTQISVLRYYDKIGLIKPVIDKFTGYRYYDEEQISDFVTISKFKKLGFSLKDIKNIKNTNGVKKIFDDKIKELELLIQQIKQEKSNLANNLYLHGRPAVMNNNIKFKDELDMINNIKFEDDPEIVGKWEIIGEYENKENFLENPQSELNASSRQKFKEIYFLQNGQRYWIYGWTKGYIINCNGSYWAANPYTTETINGEKYMFADWKSYGYFKNNEPATVLVLKQSDNKKYTLAEISRTDNIDMPFANDEKVLGKWKSIAYINNKTEYFNPDYPQNDLFFKYTEFKENGWCERISGENNNIWTSPGVTWTKGYILCKAGRDGTENTAEKYEIKIIDGRECLLIEWKSGDYIWGGREPNYYVFARD